MKTNRDVITSSSTRRAQYSPHLSGAKSVVELNNLMSRLKWSCLTAKSTVSPPLSRLERATSVPRRDPPLFSLSPERPSPGTTRPRRKLTGGSLDTRARGVLNFLSDGNPESPLGKTPDLLPGMLNEQSRRLALIDCENDIHKEIERLQQHIRSNSTASRREKSLMLRQGIRPVTPYMEFEGLRMPTDLVILTQTRRRVIAEIRKQSIPGLVMSKLNEMKTVLMPENMKNVEVASNSHSERVVHKQKNVKDMRSRSQFATTMYGLMALPKHSKVALKEAFGEVMPEGSRFTDDRLFK